MAETVTDSTGFYQFDNHVQAGDDSPYETAEAKLGLSVGNYKVRLVKPANWLQTSLNPATVDISRGMVESGFDIGVAKIKIRPIFVRPWNDDGTPGREKSPTRVIRNAAERPPVEMVIVDDLYSRGW